MIDRAGSFMAALDASGREEFGTLGRTKRHRAGAVLFLEGDRSTNVLTIREGNVKVTTTTPDGHEVVLGILGSNELAGELAALDDDRGHRRSANVIAMNDVVVQVIPNDDFVRFLERHPRALLALTRTVIGRLHDADRRRAEFGAYDTLGRVARVLSELAQLQQPHDGAIRLDPPLTQHELAGLVGASRESVVRALAELRRRGVIETGRRSLVVRDLAGLERCHG